MLYYDVFFSNTTNAPTKISSLSATVDVPKRRDDYNQQLRFFFAVKSTCHNADNYQRHKRF